MEEVAAFINGYYSGAPSDDPTISDEQERWYAFCAWASKQVDGAEDPSFYAVVKALRRTHTDDATAFHRFAELFIAFRGLEDGESQGT